MSYTSPIEMYYKQIEMKVQAGIEDAVYNAVQRVGINVDRNELIRALAYDRGQYEKGMLDARLPAQWLRKPDGGYMCSRCGVDALFDNTTCMVLSKHCPECGARMKIKAETPEWRPLKMKNLPDWAVVLKHKEEK